MRVLWTKAKNWKAALSMLLAAAIVTSCLNVDGFAVYADAAERTFEIGANTGSVTAVLDENGVLTVSGSGSSRDYTPETAPFREIAEQITAVKLGPDVVSLGDCLFYNCGNLSGEIILPARLVRIGDRAFSGDRAAQAPKPDLVENPFTETLVTREKENSPQTSSAPTAASPKPSPSAAPAAASQPDGNEETKDTADRAKAANLPEENKSEPAPTEEPAANLTAPPTAEPSPVESPAATEVPESAETPKPAASAVPVSPFPSPAPDAGEENRYIIENITRQEIGADVFYPCAAGEVRAFTCSAENETFRAAMLAAGYVEAEGTVSATFDCGEGISSTGGVVTKALPLHDGGVILPGALTEFSAPEGGELFSYAFGGWTESRDGAGVVRTPGSRYLAEGKTNLYFIAGWNREVLVKIIVERSGELLKLSVPVIGGYDCKAFRWQTCAVTQEKEAPENQELLSWEDIAGETGRTYERKLQQGDENRMFRCVVTVSKQQSFLRALFSGSGEEELALDGVRGGEVPGADGDYRITCERGSYGEKALPGGSDPVPTGVARGDYGVIPSCPYTAPALSAGTAVFNGWMGSDGVSYDPGDMVRLTGDLTLTAQWAAATVAYLDGTVSDSAAQDSSSGQSADSPRKYFSTYTAGGKTYYGVNDLFSGGTKYTNVIVVCGNAALGGGNGAGLGSVPFTLTNRDPVTGTLHTGTVTVDADLALNADTRFCEITVTGVNNSIYAQGNQLVMGEAVDTGAYSLNLYGGFKSSAGTGSPKLLLQSGSYLAVYGGNYENTLIGDPTVRISGTAKAGVVFGAGCSIGSTVNGSTEVLMSGEATAAMAVGGNRSSDSNAGVTGKAHVMVGGSARVEDPGATIRDNAAIEFDDTGFIAGSGAESGRANGDGNVRGGTLVEVRQNAFIEKGVYGGSGNGWQDPAVTDAGQNTWLGTKGDMEVRIAGGTVGGSVYGGGNSRSCEGNATVTVTAGTIAGSVYGGGFHSNLTGSADVAVYGGTIRGGVYGGGYGAESPVKSTEVVSGSVGNDIYGGNYAYVTGDTRLTLKAETEAVFVGGSVYGGGNLNRKPGVGFDNDSFLVLGSSSILLDGSSPGVTVNGSMFGSGRLTRVQGGGTLQIQSFTGTLQSIQRTSLTEITGSQVVLTGAEDSTGDQGSKRFSIAKVDDLRLTDSTLRLESEIRELGALGNYNAFGSVSSGESARSTLQAAPGLLLQIMPSPESGGAGGYGPVSGVFWLEMTEKAAGGRGVRIEADETGEIGDTAGDTGAFLKKDSAVNAGLDMVSGSVAGSHHFWRLGGSVLESRVSLTAVKQEPGGQSIVTQSFQLPTAVGSTVYKITGMKKVSGSFTLVKPTEGADEGMALPAFAAGQSADDTFALRIDPTDSGGRGTWEGLETNGTDWGSYVLTQLPQGETAWNTGVEGVWKRGTTYPKTISAGSGAGSNAEVTFSLIYDASYESFSGGELELTLQEYESGGAMDETALKNTVVVKLTLEWEQGATSQRGYVERGRKFRELSSSEPVSLTPNGAVTAGFTTEYYPAAGAESMYLSLCAGSGAAAALSAFPEGTRIVLADLGAAGDYRYYFYRTSAGEQKLSLAGFTSLGGNGSVTYPGPADVTDRVEEKLLFAVDFAGADSGGLTQGEYFLSLTHTAAEAPQEAAPAAFSIVEGQPPTLELEKLNDSTTDTMWALALTPNISEMETRYADGAGIRVHLTDSDGKSRAFPEKVIVGGDAQTVLRDSDGSISFALPSSGRSVVTLDFSAVSESMFPSGDYQLSAAMRPRAGLQAGSSQNGADASPAPVAFSVTRAVRAERSISVSLKDGSQRLADASEQAVSLDFALEYRSVQAGDRLEAALLRKTGSTPDDSSYTQPAGGEGFVFSPAPGEAAGTGGEISLTVPQGAESGTYRVLFRLVDPSGGVLAEEPYNFIVK